MYVDRPAAAEIEEKKELEKTPFEYVAATINATGVYIHTWYSICICPYIIYKPTQDLAELEDYQRIQTRRIYVEKWVEEPYFEKVALAQLIIHTFIHSTLTNGCICNFLCFVT